MLKSDGVRFLWKIHFCTNWAKRIPKSGILHFLKILSFVFPFKKRQNGSSFNSLFFVTNLIPDKFLFWSYWPKCSWPIRLQDSLKCNICKKIEGSSWFLFADKHQSFLQVSSIAVGGRGQTYPKYLK